MRGFQKSLLTAMFAKRCAFKTALCVLCENLAVKKLVIFRQLLLYYSNKLILLQQSQF